MDKYKNYGYLNLADENRVPLESKTDSFGHLLLFWILPFIVLNVILFFLITGQPKFSINVEDSSDFETTQVTIDIKSLIPVKNVSASISSEEIELEKISSKKYLAKIETNGTLEVKVTNFNGMERTEYEDISILDVQPPTITEIDSQTDMVEFLVEDKQSGVDFSSLRAVDSNGNVIEPNLLDEGAGKAIYYFTTPTLDIQVSDLAGHSTMATFENKKPISIE